MEEVEVEEEEMPQHWKTGASSAHPLAKQRNNKGRPSGTGTVSHKRRELYRQRGEEKRIARERAEEEERQKKAAEDEVAAARAAEEKKKKAAEDEAAAARTAEEEKKKTAEDELAAKKEEEDKKKNAAEKKEKEVKKEETKKEEPPEPTLAQRVEKLSLAERLEEKTDQNKTGGDDMLKDDRNEAEKAETLEKRETKLEVESSDDDLDCRSKRDNQKGRGVSVKLQLGPSKAEVERTTKKMVQKSAAASSSTQPSKKSRASPLRDPTPLAERGQETFLDKRRKEASFDQRGVCIDYHNVLEKGWKIHPANVRALQSLKRAGYRVHLLSFCGENRWKEEVHPASLGCWDGWSSLVRTPEPTGKNGKFSFMVEQK